MDFPIERNILIGEAPLENSTHQQLVSVHTTAVKCTECCLRQDWTMTQPHFLCRASGKEKREIDRKVVYKTKGGGRETSKNNNNFWSSIPLDKLHLSFEAYLFHSGIGN